MAITVDLCLIGRHERTISGSSAMRIIIIIKWILIIIAVCLATTSLIPFSISYGAPHLKLLLVILEPQVWQGAMQFLTHEPVLFVLVNLVILSIWVSSGAACNAVIPDPITKEEKLPSVCVGNTAKLQRQILYSTHKQHMTSTPTALIPAASSPQPPHTIINAQSKVVSPNSTLTSFSYTSRSAAGHAQLKTSIKVECSSAPSSFQAAISKNIHIPASGSEPKLAGAIAPDQVKRSYSMESNASAGPHTLNQTSKKLLSEVQIAKETKNFTAISPDDPGAVATNRTKFEKRSESFPQLRSRVIVRDRSGRRCSRPEVVVMEKDELNERIEAFFAKFRESLRKESLCSQQN